MRWVCALALVAAPATAQDVWVLGEVHDNPTHHETQAERVADIAPSAIVFEMMTPEAAKLTTPQLRGDPVALASALDWDASGWPDFYMYYPIIAGAPDAQIIGAGVPRQAARDVAESGLIAAFGAGAEALGLTAPLAEAEQAARQDMQAEAHCGALPDDMLPMMVDIQRLRDAALAQAAITAVQQTGGPVAVITGNGHARADWGVPALIERAAPDLEVHALGQGEDGRPPDGVFDEVADAPAPERGDPCEAFQ